MGKGLGRLIQYHLYVGGWGWGGGVGVGVGWVWGCGVGVGVGWVWGCGVGVGWGGGVGVGGGVGGWGVGGWGGWQTLVKWLGISSSFIRSSRQATLPWFPQGENSFQIRNSLKWNLTKDRSRGATLIQRPLASGHSIIDLLSSNLVVLMTWGPVHKRFSVTCGML